MGLQFDFVYQSPFTRGLHSNTIHVLIENPRDSYFCKFLSLFVFLLSYLIISALHNSVKKKVVEFTNLDTALLELWEKMFFF